MTRFAVVFGSQKLKLVTVGFTSGKSADSAFLKLLDFVCVVWRYVHPPEATALPIVREHSRGT